MKKTYLSYSQITLWLSSKKTYIQKYFEGLEGYQTDAMKIGKEIDDIKLQVEFGKEKDATIFKEIKGMI